VLCTYRVFSWGAGAGAEVIRQATRKGGLLTTEICVLDDISRAPGEALNVLLRLLNERRWTDGSPIPLVSAIATANPPRDDYFNEPLDPANLDRFTLQVKASGLVQRKSWHDAARVVERFGSMPHTERSAALQDGTEGSNDLVSADTQLKDANSATQTVELSVLHAAHRSVSVPRRVQRLVLLLLAELVTGHGCTPANSLLTDRTFLVKAPRIMQAAALLDGRNDCEPADLHVLSLLTTFRVPEKVQESMEEIIDEVLRREAEDDDDSNEPGASNVSARDQQVQGQQQNQDEEERKQEEQRRKERDEMMKAMSDEGGLLRTDGVEKSGATWSMQQKYPRLHEAMRKLSASIMGGGDAPTQNLDRETISNMDALLKIFGGKQQRSNMEEVAHHGGQPRRWRRMAGIEGLEDCEPVESSIWCQNVNPQMPRTVQRERQARGGSLAIVRLQPPVVL
jgi:MoxR-like ATPase